MTNIEFIKGSFQHPGIQEQADLIISSAALHHVKDEEKPKAITNVHDILNAGGRLILCDPFFFFDPEKEPERFNKIYRYLTPRTLPEKVFIKYIKPHFDNNPDYIYTWEDMKKYTPEEGQYYKVVDLITLLEKQGFTITKQEALTPFFGILCACKR